MHSFRFYLLLGSLFVYFNTSHSKAKITVGLLAPFTGSWDRAPRFASAVAIAVDYINKNTTLLQSHDLDYFVHDTACSESGGVAAAVNLMQRNVSVFIGPACSKSCQNAGFVAAAYNIPMVSYGCSTTTLSNTKLYPNLFRTKPFARGSKRSTSLAIASIMDDFNWKYCCFAEDIDSVFTPLAEEIASVFTKRSIKIGRIERFYQENYDAMDVMRKLRPFCRVILLICYSRDATVLAMAAKRLGMHNGDFVFLAIDLEVSSNWDGESWTNGFRPVVNVLNGLISFKVYKVNMREKKYDGFNEEVTRRMAQPPFNINTTKTVLSSAAYLYDAVLHYTHALNASMANGNNWNNNTAVTNMMFKTSFTGITGRVTFDENGDRVPLFIVDNVQNGKFIAMQHFDPIANSTLRLNGRFLFPGGSAIPPRDVPVCGFDGNFCPKTSTSVPYAYAAAIPAPFVVILIAVLIYFKYKKRKYELVVLEKELIVDCDSISFNKAQSSLYSKASCRSNFFARLSIGSEDFTPNIHSVVLYKTGRVHIKKFQNSSSYHALFTKERLIELKKIKMLHHTNVNVFIGAGLWHGELWILWQHCIKGSLQDVLQNDDHDIDWMFKFSFAIDIVKAMVEIHKTFGVHGNLKSSNCLVDSRWVVKVSDFGYFCLLDKNDSKSKTEFDDMRALIWTAPEFLGARCNAQRTKDGDVYSFGIIMKEIASRSDPYEDSGLAPSEIIGKVELRTLPAYRPALPLDCNVPTGFMKLMVKCWDEFADQRPNFKDVFKALRALGPKNSTNLVDQMLTMMEKYTNRLEDLVRDRTRQLEEEKMKTDKLLEKMLPPSVANDLKVGKPVPAEHFAQVTIFFSDIVGFTVLAANSTPMQVVQLLNDLYSNFDKIIQNFDVYKVETIGDAYMVVSGLPKRNGKKHAGEIATMALHLLHSMRSFKVNHKPGYQLQLRIGIHTGSCVAGVVGLTMPRYCLFGDTVNFASRMESSGLALRIHVSPYCKAVLEDLGGYRLEERGPVTMKGKGSVITYFLVGKDGFNLLLPDLDLATSPSEHEFK